ncbi:Hsp20/alpha crystallin family protein [Alistipes sp. ZOR0009]|jgi:HSP20 family protein|uniref:Hsp20/alpha crystallin family protein n=1 Tax=Alistipes sp. ZOR0009 TaxID=1339253 RepID=UPI0006477A6D|nr:Hsp20/alpha crystallin family protein [Alistipes sp. ZOR0009]
MTLTRFSNQLPTLFERLFENDMLDWSNRNYSTTNTTLPSVNIKENEEGFEVEMAIPGMDKGDFKIELNHDVLTISSEKKVENEVKEGEHFTRREFSYQAFSRSFTLPNTVDNERINAKYENGILSVAIPKREEARPKPVRQIAIS